MATATANAQTAAKARKAKKPPSPARLAAEADVKKAREAVEAAKSPQEKTVAEARYTEVYGKLKALRFTELGAARIRRALNVLRQLENVANPATYSWTEEQGKKAAQALADGVKRVSDKLLRVKGKKEDFSF
jgi:hypothetical protein